MKHYIDSRTCIFYLLHYPLVRFRALLIRDMLDNSFIFSDTDAPGHSEPLTKSTAQQYLDHRPEILDLGNPHHREMVESFGLTLKSPLKEAK